MLPTKMLKKDPEKRILADDSQDSSLLTEMDIENKNKSYLVKIKILCSKISLIISSKKTKVLR